MEQLTFSPVSRVRKFYIWGQLNKIGKLRSGVEQVKGHAGDVA
jgi:hypothetical protein